MIGQLSAMESGECRWIGRPHIHAYCRSPARQPARWMIVTAELPYNDSRWCSLEEAAAFVERLLEKEDQA